jgi:hypothetical protein
MSTRQENPAAGCKANKEDLLESKKVTLDVIDDCPNCEKLGILCFVSNHPSRTRAGDEKGVHAERACPYPPIGKF